uniref:Uncharacterized protein n=1 Tax=Vespula pensylvanica TaxID=30213 RepID=A0A834UCK2_VESPE|nr:hypothetical protein H0235_006356 [Vespula pensylvanica]
MLGNINRLILVPRDDGDCRESVQMSLLLVERLIQLESHGETRSVTLRAKKVNNPRACFMTFNREEIGDDVMVNSPDLYYLELYEETEILHSLCSKLDVGKTSSFVFSKCPSNCCQVTAKRRSDINSTLTSQDIRDPRWEILEGFLFFTSDLLTAHFKDIHSNRNIHAYL